MSHFEGSCPTCGQASVDAMTAQAQRDHALAAEWQASAEAYRADANVAKGRVAELAKQHELAEAECGRHRIDLAAAHARIAEWERYTEAQKAVVRKARRDRTAANARVAELETVRAENNSDNRALREKLAAANARADAAEQSVKNNVERGNGYRDAFERAESEAAAVALREPDRRSWTAKRTRVAEVESEAAALRAEVERLKHELNDSSDVHARQSLEASLAAATALLERVRNPVNKYDVVDDDIDDFLSTTPAPSERAAAERAVLDACAAMRLDEDNREDGEDLLEPSEHGEDCYVYTDDQYKIAKAELARRAVTK